MSRGGLRAEGQGLCIHGNLAIGSNERVHVSCSEFRVAGFDLRTRNQPGTLNPEPETHQKEIFLVLSEPLVRTCV